MDCTNNIPCADYQPNNRVRAFAELADRLVLTILEGIAKIDGMEAARAILFDPLAVCVDLFESPVLVVRRQLMWRRCRRGSHLDAKAKRIESAVNHFELHDTVRPIVWKERQTLVCVEGEARPVLHAQ